jgi:cytochrome-b5 reductase
MKVMDAIVRNPADKTKVTLVFCNQTEKDIILKDQLDKWAKDPRVTVMLWACFLLLLLLAVTAAGV